MSHRPTLWDTVSTTSSPESACGATPSGSRDGRTTGPSGPAAPPVSPLARRERERVSPTFVISGPSGTALSENADLFVGEQVAGKAGLEWFDAVSADLEAAGYAVGAVDFCAAGVGAPHIRQRLYWLAHADREQFHRAGNLRPRRRNEPPDGGGTCRPAHAWTGRRREVEWIRCRDGKTRPAEPGTFPLADGAPARVGRLRGYGNAIVAPQAAAFIEAVMDILRQDTSAPTL